MTILPHPYVESTHIHCRLRVDQPHPGLRAHLRWTDALGAAARRVRRHREQRDGREREDVDADVWQRLLEDLDDAPKGRDDCRVLEEAHGLGERVVLAVKNADGPERLERGDEKKRRHS